MKSPQFVDERVSRRKFEREIDEYRRQEVLYRARGWLLLDAQYPIVRVAFCATKLKPPAVIAGVRLDYTNYDAQPPAFRMVNPFTDEPYKASELPTVLRRQGGPGGAVPFAIPGLPPGAQVNLVQETQLMAAYDPEEVPFLCLPGVREYHEHPAHSGDRWEKHRPLGAGRLVNILQVVDTYGLQPITDYQLQLKMEVVGFLQGNAPG